MKKYTSDRIIIAVWGVLYSLLAFFRSKPPTGRIEFFIAYIFPPFIFLASIGILFLKEWLRIAFIIMCSIGIISFLLLGIQMEGGNVEAGVSVMLFKGGLFLIFFFFGLYFCLKKDVIRAFKEGGKNNKFL